MKIGFLFPVAIIVAAVVLLGDISHERGVINERRQDSYESRI
ncbi:YoaK family small membrane protein [Serratia entomophila]|uniref:YoaK family small membrane protein n=1 Tax=Serratia entomophila TaxID=42906 RepID=A0ABY5CX08_9GAMM|nr:YoaK family small membrane protein [Serratia entomophila]UIW19508.1 YoaK family small membrane protein [Serratia entomophila]USV02033.1 YoaK family small membrane protein [Serratia entomophila]